MKREMLNLNAVGIDELNTADQIVNFPYGIVGFEECRNFILYKVKNERLKGLVSLECLDMDHLRFISIPTSYNTLQQLQLVKEEDLNELLEITNIQKENLLLLFLVTIQEHEKIFFNHRAPIVIDISTKSGMQVVFDETYDLSADILTLAGKK